MNLIRLLLLEVEEEPPKPDLSKYSEMQQVYHAALLIEASLIKGEAISDAHGELKTAIMQRLTWAGHEFLDAARDEKGWKKVLAKVQKQGGGVTISILESLLKDYLKEKLGVGD